MIKSSRKINNIVKGFLFLGSCVGASAFVWANPMDECADEEYSSSVNLEKGAVQRAQKIVNLALFDAIDQGGLKGVTFLIEGGADPKAENKRGRTPLDLAEHLAEKHPDEPAYQEIVDSLRDWDSEQYAVDDETVINTAQKIWGLNGGGLGKFIKTAGEVVKKVREVVKQVATPNAIEKAAQSKTVKKTVESGVKSAKEAVPKPLAKAVPSPERIINTAVDCIKYIDSKISSGICRKTNKRYKDQPVYEVIKKDGILKKGDYIYRDTRHHEIELMRSDMETHKGAIDPKTGNLYKKGVPGRNIKGLK